MAFHWKNFLRRGPERIHSDHVVIDEMPFEEIGVTLGYILIAGFWVVFSDDLFDWLMGAPINSPALQTLKGINFVCVTALVLYVVLRRSFLRRRQAQEALRLSQERFESVARAAVSTARRRSSSTASATMALRFLKICWRRCDRR